MIVAYPPSTVDINGITLWLFRRNTALVQTASWTAKEQ